MSTATGPSFISYVTETEKDKRRDQRVAEAMTKIHQVPQRELENRLLAGEIAIGHANKVIRYNVHDDPARGISGTLVCTNFRLLFITAEKATYDLIELKNRIIHEHDVLLNNIESIFVEYPNKRKKLVPGSKVKENIQRLELQCKDFRVAAYNFKLTVKGEEKGVITSLLHHAYPQTVTRLFAFDYQHGKNIDEVCKIPLYRSPSDWDSELRRCGVTNRSWRTSVINRKFQAMETMSSYFVIPGSIKDGELSDIAQQFVGDRIPVWCWTDSNGCSLVRGSALRTETEMQECELRVHDAIIKACPNNRPLKVVDVSKVCPSCLQLQQSFNKLKSMCMSATEAEFWENDSRWFSCCSKWFQHVSTVLSTAKDAAKCMREKKLNVIVQEAGGPDLSSVVTSLIQLMLDPSCRTLEGFQAVIQREWVVAGHPFLDRLGHLLQPKKKGKQVTSVFEDGNTAQLAPVFLLFLDCVYQMMVQFPSRFELSVTFLIVLYDATRTTTFETFIFNNEKQRRKSLGTKEWHGEPFAAQEVDRVPKTQLLPVWVWGAQYNTSDMALFNNPLYKMRTMTNYKDYVKASMNGNYSNSLENHKKRPPENQLNGDIPDSTVVFSHSPSDSGFTSSEPKRNHGKKTKINLGDEHTRKMLRDSPVPLKVRQKSASLEENATRKVEDNGKNSTAATKKEPYKATPSGHYPKIALMPRQKSAAIMPVKEDPVLERSSSRSKSDSECNDEDMSNHVDDGITAHGDEDSLEPSRFNIRTRFSRRRKKKGSLDIDDLPTQDVPTYGVKLRNKSVQPTPLESDVSSDSVQGLYPATNVANLKLWRQCYLRWLPWSQIYGGGPASMLQQESLLYDEIHALHCKLRMLKRQLHNGPRIHVGGDDESLPSGMFFNCSMDDSHPVFETNSNKSSSQNSLNILSSYFPYSPITELRSKSVLGTPMSNFLQGGSLFNFGRRAKHSRSPSNISIAYALSQSIEDLTSAALTDVTADASSSSTTKSMEDLTLDGSQGANVRDRTHSDVPPGRKRLQLLQPGAVRPKISTAPASPVKEDITYVTSL